MHRHDMAVLPLLPHTRPSHPVFMQQGYCWATLLTTVLTLLGDEGAPDDPSKVVQWRALWLADMN